MVSKNQACVVGAGCLAQHHRHRSPIADTTAGTIVRLPEGSYAEELAAIAEQYPKVADARPWLHALSIEKKCRFMELLDIYLKLAPAQTYTCWRCQAEVRTDEISGGQCLDCIAESYDAAAEEAMS